VALAKLRDCGIANMPDSLYRDLRVRELLRPQIGALTGDKIKAALFDDFESPFSVCRPPRKSFVSNNLSATVAMIVMQPEAGTMEVAMLPALNRRFTTYSLEMAPAQPGAATQVA
jgi:isopenicillin-N N-acyltransferase-like protein